MNDRPDRDPPLPPEMASSTEAARDPTREAAKPARLLVVLGMHRSGTSVVTRGLQALGVALGDDLMKPVAGNNEKGFFEDMDFYRLNERLLSKSASAWHRLAPLDAQALSAGPFSAERREASALLNKKLADHGLFAFKDPRTAVLMPFWRCVIDDLELDDRYIIVIRHPLEAAASLERRDGLPLAKGVALWAKHVIEAVRNTEGRPRVFVRFDHVLQNPKAELQRIADVLGLPNENLDAASLDAYAEEFLAPDLRHHLLGRGELARSGLAPAYVVELYDHLLRLSQTNDPNIAPPQSAWDSVVARFIEAAPLLALSDELDSGLRIAMQRAGAAEKLNADLKAAAESERTRAAHAAEQQMLSQKALAAKTAQLDALSADLTRTRQDAAEAAALSAAELAETLTRAETQAIEQRLCAEHALAAKDAQLDALNADLTRTRQDAAKVAAQYAAELAEARIQAAADAVHSRDQLEQAAADRKETEDNLVQLRHELNGLRQLMADAVRDAEISVDLEARLREATYLSASLEIKRLREAHETLQAANLTDNTALRATLEVATAERDLAQAQLDTLRNELLEVRHSLADALHDGVINLDLESRLRDAHLLSAELDAKRLKDAFDTLRANNEASLARTNAKLGALEHENGSLRRAHQQALAEAGRQKENADKQLIANADLLAGAQKLQNKFEALIIEKRHLRRDLLLTRGALTAARQSLSWRVTAPLRSVIRVARDPIGGSRAVASMLARATWRRIPLSPERRGRLAARLFSVAPALFFWTNTYKAWRSGGRPETQASSDDAKEPSLDPALEGYTPLLATSAPQNLSARAIAFYLPQFHPIPENDAWWGKGFTEWTKVRAAIPRFEGHYQPHEPDDAIGHYDLVADPNVMRKQAELAKLHGIEGFCFYFYWFAGKRLLETPLLNLLDDKSIELPFCLCWANENWTRRWDGKDSEILIAQDHSDTDDLAFIKHVSRYFSDPRYIRIDGRPLLLVYRPALLPSVRKTAQRWRKWLRDNGLGEIYLAYTQSFESPVPAEIGFDAAIEFPPNNMGLARDASLAGAQQEESNLAIYDWRALVARSRRYLAPAYKLFRAVTPSWDNTARRPRDGTVLAHASPNAFHEWLSNAIADAKRRIASPEERLVFINAWNEWAEGAHLEPDKRHGFAWLEAARRALAPEAERPKVLVITHDLRPHGAQYIAMNLARALRRQYGCDVATLTIEDGPLNAEFAAEGPLHIVDRNDNAQVATRLSKFATEGYHHAIVNSAASAWISPALATHRIAHIGLVHELPRIIESRRLGDDIKALDANARAIIFPADVVRDRDAQALGLKAWTNAIVQAQGLYKAGVLYDFSEKDAARRQLANQLGVPSDTRFALGVGYADKRKGVDTFVDWALAAAARWPSLHFVWVGDVDPVFKAELEKKLHAARAHGAHIHLLPFIADTTALFAAADIYALSSREDPFPSTALEALAAATPVVMIKGAGGIEELRTHGCVIATAPHPESFVASIAPWMNDPAQRGSAGLRGRALIAEKFGAASYAGVIADALDLKRPNISAVVPNYNYAHHLEQRLTSIINQTLAPREIIFLDDGSTDDSVAIAERILGASNINWRIVRNAQNSGSVFAQWRKGTELAQGDLVWIAEADDWADPRFLEAASKPFARADVVLSMTESRQVDGDDQLLAPNYLDYVRDVSPDKWTKPFIGGGPEEIRAGLAIKNTIPNASAVLFRRLALRDALAHAARELASYRVAGDWCVYVNMLRHGALAFSPSALNHHRRHAASATLQRFTPSELAELARMQAYVAREFSVSDADQARARAYLDRLVAQFELEKRFSPAQIAGALRGVAAA
jgi:glycosyltransferase involved in cell wall biosynthesis